LIVVCALPILSAFACFGDRPTVALDMPPMPAEVRKSCRHPDLVEIDARAMIGRYSQALDQCDGRRADAVAFGDDLRKGMSR
jgi:hypothetical protein